MKERDHEIAMSVCGIHAYIHAYMHTCIHTTCELRDIYVYADAGDFSGDRTNKRLFSRVSLYIYFFLRISL